jgi:hypothetical protein
MAPTANYYATTNDNHLHQHDHRVTSGGAHSTSGLGFENSGSVAASGSFDFQNGSNPA